MFGQIHVRVAEHNLGPRDFGGIKPKQILEILLAERGGPVSKDRFADHLWGSSLPRNVSATLETYISVLRRCLDAGGDQGKVLVLTEPGAYRFAVEGVEIDLDRFDSLANRAAQVDNHQARPLLSEALELARGDILEDEPYAEWLEPLRDQYRKKVMRIRLDLAEAALADADFQASIDHAEKAMSEDPHNERAYRLAMLGSYALGRQKEALETFDRCRESLTDALGVDPLEETRNLHMSILRQEDAASLLPQRREQIEVLDDVLSDRLPFLGRIEELGQIDGVISAAMAGRFALVRVEGESGIGKSRFLDSVGSNLSGTRVGRARCSPVEKELPYVPLAMALREALQDISIDRTRFPCLADVLPELWLSNTTLEIPQVKVLETISEIIRENAPMVLLLDDSQWADASTVAALGYLQRRLEDAAVTIVVAYNPEELIADDPLQSLDATQKIRLEPLSEEDLAPLGVDNLHARTGGHPLFVAACVGAKSEGDAGTLPPTLTELVIERARGEGERAHRILLSASAIAQPFDPETLAVLLEEDAFHLLSELERLSERNLLKVDGNGFSFRVELVREVLSHSMSPARRRLQRHRAVDFENLVSMAVPERGTDHGSETLTAVS
jgi:DNA-binding SARP family transcriptional activator